MGRWRFLKYDIKSNNNQAKMTKILLKLKYFHQKILLIKWTSKPQNLVIKHSHKIQKWKKKLYCRTPVLCVLNHFSHVWLFETPWTCSPPDSFFLWDSLGKNTGVGCHVLLQGIFWTQRSNPHLLHCRWILYHWAFGKAHKEPLPLNS